MHYEYELNKITFNLQIKNNFIHIQRIQYK
jgi:hypothetical protein